MGYQMWTCANRRLSLAKIMLSIIMSLEAYTEWFQELWKQPQIRSFDSRNGTREMMLLNSF